MRIHVVCLFFFACSTPPNVVGTGATSSSSTGGAGAGVGGNHGFGGAPPAKAPFKCDEPDSAYFVQLSGDGPDQQLSSGCTEAMPWGHALILPAGDGGFDIFACQSGSPVELDLNYGTSRYVDGTQKAWWATQATTLTITSYGAEGAAIDGTFSFDAVESATSTTSSGTGVAPLVLSGTFHVCHRPDLNAP